MNLKWVLLASTSRFRSSMSPANHVLDEHVDGVAVVRYLRLGPHHTADAECWRFHGRSADIADQVASPSLCRATTYLSTERNHASLLTQP